MRLEHSGAARKATVTVDLGGTVSDLTVTCDDLTGWPTGSVGPFYGVINKGLVNQEKILFANRTGNVLTVYTDGLSVGRAADGTVIQSHLAGSIIEHVWTASEADAANAHVNDTTGVHGVTGAIASEASVTAEAAARAAADALLAPLAGATFTGAVNLSQGAVTKSPTAGNGSYGVRQIYTATGSPVGHNDWCAEGDVWIVYVP